MPTKMRNAAQILLLHLFLFLFLLPPSAAGYTIFTEQNETTMEIGVYYWSLEDIPVTYLLDGGPQGMLAGVDLEAFIRKNLQPWTAVDTAYIAFESQGTTDEDLNVETLFDDPNSPYLLIGDGIHEIIIDQDGSIMAELGADPETVIGFGIPVVNGDSSLPENPFDGRILDGFILLNTSIDFPEEVYAATITHEVGHFIGLGHTTVVPQTFTENFADTEAVAKTPTMYAFTLPDPPGCAPLLTLEADDVAALSALYPACGSTERYGVIEGVVRTSGGAPVFGASVAALKMAGDQIETAVSGLSGYRTGPDGGGEFRIAGLPPGEYAIRVQPITPREMGMGPETVGLLFSEADTFFRCEFLDDLRCASATPPPEARRFQVTAGQRITGIEIVVNGDNPGYEVRTEGGGGGALPYTGGTPVGGFPDCGGFTTAESGETTAQSEETDPGCGCSLRHENGPSAG